MSESTHKYSLRKTAFDVFLTFGRQFLAGLMQLIIIVIIARNLGQTGAGYYAISLLLPTVMATLLSFGITAANVYFYASNQRTLEIVWTVSRDFTLLVAMVGTATTFALILAYGPQLFPGVPSIYLQLTIFIFPLSIFGGLLNNTFQALQDFRSFNLTTLCQPTIAFLGTLALFTMDMLILERVFILIILSHFGTVILGSSLLSRYTPVWQRRQSWNYISDALRYGCKAHLGRIATVLISRSDLFLINWYLGPAAAGIYGIAVRITEQLWIISQATSTVLFPKLSAMTEDKEQRQELIAIMLQMIFWLSLSLCLALFLVSKPLILFLFGDSFRSAVLPLMILLPGVVLFSSSRVLANDFAARNLIHINLALTLATLFLNVAGNIALIPIYGISGAALATSFAYALNYGVRLFIYNRISGMKWTRAIAPTDLIRRLHGVKKGKKHG